MRIYTPPLRITPAVSLSNLSMVLCFSLMTAGLTSCSDQRKNNPSAGEKFPITLFDQFEPVQNTSIDITNKTLIINFWATWCKPCREEMPNLQRLSEALDRQQYAVIGISIDDDSNLIKEFLFQHQIEFTHFQDKNSQLSGKLLKVKALPETFIISAGGLIIKRVLGEQPWDETSFHRLIQPSLRAERVKG